ncbi:MAG: FUSC family protein, partial [Actinomycetes bacterium]
GHAGAWLMLTIIVVLQPFVKDGFIKVIHRAAGTILGFIIAFGIASVTQIPVVLEVLGMVIMIGAIVIMITKRPYWEYATALTTAIVLLEGANTSVIATDEMRLGATMVGCVAVLIVTAVVQPFAKHSSLKAGVTHY